MLLWFCKRIDIRNMNNKYTALLFLALVAATEASDSFAKVLQPSLLANDGKIWDGLGLQADVNEYVDKTISMIVPLMHTYGLDPMVLPEVIEGFEVRPILITYSAWLKIHDGHMTGLGNVARSGDQQVNYFAKMLRIRLSFQVTDLKFVYNYLVKVMKIGPTGGIVGTLERLTIVFDLLIDFNNDELHLQEFSISEIGRLRVRFTGNILTDWLVNPVIRVFTSIFDNTIIRVVQSNIQNAIQDGLDFINANVKDIIESIENYGRDNVVSNAYIK